MAGRNLLLRTARGPESSLRTVKSIFLGGMRISELPERVFVDSFLVHQKARCKDDYEM